MCRWFGHKRNDIDLQSVYLQEHSQILFQEISQSDKELRQQFRTHIFNDVPNECLLLSLFSSPLFRSTSPTKSKFLEKVDASYSGINKDMLDSIQRDILIMHPGPINRGVELSSDAADSKQSIILNQVENGVAIRMAVIYLLSGKAIIE